ncbi:phospholipase A-2-activating protein [Backusella circina FSU 941]|nr:phospholipase A-2-activating protein [Backusella circina FSU 941]
MTQTPYKLECTLRAHENDVKAIAAFSNDALVSCSRDKTIRSWSRTSPNLFSPDKVYKGHDHFVNSVAVIRPNTEFPNGLVISGGSDKVINVYEPTQPENPRYALLGHTENVTTLSVSPSGHIVSGSWDKKAIVWKGFQQSYVLEGHSAAIWAVLFVEDDLVLTASADKTIRLWREGRQVHIYQGHTDAVRGLALLPGVGFVSCSNDASLRIWSLDGQCLQELHGHTSFVYSVGVLESGEIVSCGEDRTARIWKDGNCIQTLQQPCITVWTVAILPNSDIAVGGSDSAVRIFTRDHERMAAAEDLKEFDELLAMQAIPANQVGDVKKENLPGPEALQQPGNREGQVVMVNTGTAVEAHQWNSASNTWEKIGEVVGAVGNDSKQVHEGKEYDYVFDIDVGAGPNGNLKLPYNVTQNPYDAAQKFLLRNELDQSFLDQVADFIIKNTGNTNLGGGEAYQDPFTGGGSYRPGQSSGTVSSGATYSDPFTGGGSYRPSQPNPMGGSTTAYSDPFTGGGSYQSPAAQQSNQPKVLPVKEYLSLKYAVPSAVEKKIISLNNELQGPEKLTSQQLASLSAGIKYLSNPSKHPLDGIAIVVQICITWPADKRFPALDLVRLFALYAPQSLAAAVPNGNVVAFLQEMGGLNAADANVSETNAMLAYRGLANLFSQPEGVQLIWEARQIIASVMQVDVSGRFKGKTARLAISTLAVNASILFTQKQEGEVELELTGSIIELLKEEKDDENVYRFIMAIGTLMTQSSTCREAAKVLEAKPVIQKVQSSTTGQARTQKAVYETLALLN